ncbi:MAG: hypothetical protein HN390_16090 [Anaerolineae bacterium]|jgi:hypothetical protein|nr:hypothetical protein [Anaerolineae bacterium]MBT7191445.1 hypothetical protein [Anaerolineae bacterium]MBT7991477.1 hypothetical protein [Anaerolineae bacterium]
MDIFEILMWCCIVPILCLVIIVIGFIGVIKITKKSLFNVPQSTEVANIEEWSSTAKCSSCQGKLRKQGDSEPTFTELIKGIVWLIGFFTIVGAIVHVYKTFWHEEIIARKMAQSVLRQCKNCGKFATKCPKCRKVFVVRGRPAYKKRFIYTKCQYCKIKITAFEHKSL